MIGTVLETMGRSPQGIRLRRVKSGWGYGNNLFHADVPRSKSWHGPLKSATQNDSRSVLSIRREWAWAGFHEEDPADEWTNESLEKLEWSDALNKWIPDNKLQARPYMTFISNPPVIEKVISSAKEAQDEEANTICERYEIHMAHSTSKGFKAPYPKDGNKIWRNNAKRDAVRKRSEELAVERRARKAYSSPLYTSMAERKQKFRMQSSRLPQSTPVSPDPRKKQITAVPPLPLWDKQKETAEMQENTSAKEKKELSSKLKSPKLEEEPGTPLIPVTDQDTVDGKSAESKRVTFKYSHGQESQNSGDSTQHSTESKNEDELNGDVEQMPKPVTPAKVRQPAQPDTLQASTTKSQPVLSNSSNLGKTKPPETVSNKTASGLYRQTHVAITNRYRSKIVQTVSGYGKVSSIPTNLPTADTSAKLKEPSKRQKGRGDNIRSSSQQTKKSVVPLVSPTVEKKLKKKASKPAFEEYKDAESSALASATKSAHKKLSLPEINKVHQNSPNQKVAEKFQNSPNQIVTEKFQNSPNQIVTEKFQNSPNQKVAEKFQNTLNQTVAEKFQNTLNQTVAEKFQNSPNQTVAEKFQNTLNQTVAEKFQNTPNQIVAEKFPNTPNQSMPMKRKSTSQSIKLVQQDKYQYSTQQSMDIDEDLHTVEEPLTNIQVAEGKFMGSIGSSAGHKYQFPGITSPSQLVSSSSADIGQVSESGVFKPKRQVVEVRSTLLPPFLPIPKEEEITQRITKPLHERRRVVELHHPSIVTLDEDTADALGPVLSPSKIPSWIYENEESSQGTCPEVEDAAESNPEEVKPKTFDELLANLNPALIEKTDQDQLKKIRKASHARFIQIPEIAPKEEASLKRTTHKPSKDRSYEDELRRAELAEERRKRQLDMLEKLRNKRTMLQEEEDDIMSPHFEDYGFLSKYCIFSKGHMEMYRHAFDAVDDEGKGWLSGPDVMIALRGVNSKLTEAEEEYLQRILELTGYKITNGADFKLFSVLAALSQRITSLDSWMKNIIGTMDFKTLEMKMFMCKTLWECNVDYDVNKISIDQLCVELRAGGVSKEHEMEVREKLGHIEALDLLDFLTYVPLFIMIHQSVINNPLDDSRDK